MQRWGWGRGLISVSWTRQEKALLEPWKKRRFSQWRVISVSVLGWVNRSLGPVTIMEGAG